MELDADSNNDANIHVNDMRNKISVKNAVLLFKFLKNIDIPEPHSKTTVVNYFNEMRGEIRLIDIKLYNDSGMHNGKIPIILW